MDETAAVSGCHLIFILVCAVLSAALLYIQYTEDPQSVIPHFEFAGELAEGMEDRRAVEPPVPASKLAGTNLVLHDANVLFIAPSSSWRWSLAKPARIDWSVLEHLLGAFRCSYPGGPQFTVLAVDYDLDHLTDDTMEKLRGELTSRGNWNVSWEPEDVPLPGSYRVGFDRHSSERGAADLHCTVYVAATGKALMVFACAGGDGDPGEVRRYAAGLRLLHPVPRLPPYKPQPVNYVLLLAAIVAVAAAINKAKDAPFIDGWGISGLVIAAVVGYKIISVLHREEFHMISPARAAKFSLWTLVPALPALLIALYGSFRMQARRRENR